MAIIVAMAAMRTSIPSMRGIIQAQGKQCDFRDRSAAHPREEAGG